MASPSFALPEHTPVNLPYARDDILEAQDVVAAILVRTLTPAQQMPLEEPLSGHA